MTAKPDRLDRRTAELALSHGVSYAVAADSLRRGRPLPDGQRHGVRLPDTALRELLRNERSRESLKRYGRLPRELSPQQRAEAIGGEEAAAAGRLAAALNVPFAAAVGLLRS
jgi:hypothetical protein